MRDSRLNGAERGVQLAFIKSLIFNALFVALPTIAFQAWLSGQRPPLDLSSAKVALTYHPVEVAPPEGPALLAGAWAVDVADRRFGGLSGLAIEGNRLLALSDSGLLFWLDPPGNARPRAVITALPAVAGDPRYKSGRDSEALLRDPAGRGWWVAFEHRHSLLLYDPGFTRLLKRIPISGRDFSVNRGVEALAPEGKAIRAIPEAAGVSDAAGLPGGGVVRLERWLGLWGFGSRLTGLGDPIRLHLAPYDNPEGIAAAPLAEGGTRLWIVTDNDALPGRRTLLLALDVPAASKR